MKFHTIAELLVGVGFGVAAAKEEEVDELSLSRNDKAGGIGQTRIDDVALARLKGGVVVVGVVDGACAAAY
jgi:hypothetical protein